MVRSLLLSMRPGELDDAGMYVWAGILMAVSLVVSYFIALAWQRWKDRKT